MGVTAKCFVCGELVAAAFFSPQTQHREIWKNWAMSWAISLCTILDLDESFESTFAEAAFCVKCQQTVCSAEFTINSISRLQTQLNLIREDIKCQLLKNYGNIQQGREWIQAEDVSFENVIRIIALKAEPEEIRNETEFILSNHPHLQRLSKLKSRQCQDQEIYPIRKRQELNGEGRSSIRIDVEPQSTGDVSRIVQRKRQLQDKPKSPKGQKTQRNVDEFSRSVSERTIKLSRFGRKIRPTIKFEVKKDEESDCSGQESDPDYAEDADFHGPSPSDQELGDEETEESAGNGTKVHRNVSRRNSFKTPLTCNEPTCKGKKLIFPQLRNVIAHIRMEHDGIDNLETPYHCANCPLRFNRLASLRRHVEFTHMKLEKECPTPRTHGTAGESVTCHLCDKSFPAKVVPEKHLFRVHGFNWDLQCSVCLKGCANDVELKLHEGLHAETPPFTCVNCPDKTFSGRTDLIRHILRAHEWKTFWCNFDECIPNYVTFSRGSDMRTHLADVHGFEGPKLDRIYHCMICSQRLKRRHSLVTHKSIQHKVSGLEGVEVGDGGAGAEAVLPEKKQRNTSTLCTLCGKQFSNPYRLNSHMKNHAALSKPKCSMCTMAFDSSEDLEGHEKLHTTEAPFQCVLCHVCLTTTFDLQRHVYEAHIPHPFKCAEEGCDYSGDTPYKLRWHWNKTHRFDYGFKCSHPECSFQGQTASSLKWHSLRHTKVAAFRCTVEGCGLSFIYKNRLTKHFVRTHNIGTPEPVLCKICGKSFTNKASLRTHEIYHADSRPFMCDLCSATFKTKRNLTTHQKVHEKTSGTNVKLQKPRKARLRTISAQNVSV